MANFEVVDAQRQSVVDRLFATSTMEAVWPVWAPLIQQVIGTSPTPTSVLALGDHLGRIFSSTGNSGRAQSELSAGGNAWECLVTWVLNFWLIGTSAIVYKRRSDVPHCIRDALTVTYNNVRANTESDLVAVMFPEEEPLLGAPLSEGQQPHDRLALVAETRFRDLHVAVLQTKTNWNDNAQIPMMWDMLYQQGSNRARNILVGDSWQLRNDQLQYAFITVPTNKIDRFKTTSLSVKRVAQLTGGNYWGYPHKDGIALSLPMLMRRASLGRNGGKGIRESLSAALSHLTTKYSYFRV